MFLLYWTIRGKESTFLQPCPVPSVPNSHHSSSNSGTIQCWEDDKTMVRIPKISFKTFNCCLGIFFPIHDLIRDLRANFQKCSVDSSSQFCKHTEPSAVRDGHSLCKPRCVFSKKNLLKIKSEIKNSSQI